MPDRPAPIDRPWLNAHRVRAQAITLAICLWGVYAWVLATPGLRDRNHLIKGTDFLHFYTLGSVALAHRGDLLYNLPEQSALLGERVPEAAGTRYLPLYPPQVSLLFAPLAKFPYTMALALWWSLSIAIYALCVAAVWTTCPSLRAFRGTVLLLALAYPAFFHLIAWGQTSALALACFTAAYLLFRLNRPFAAGLALGCLAFKPQLAIAVAVVFLFARAWAVVLGTLLTASAQFLVGWFYYGTAAVRDYFAHLAQIPQVTALLEPRPYQTHSLRSFWQMILPWHTAAFVLYLITAIVVLILTCRLWLSRQPLRLRYSALLLATVLVSPHLTVYDLVILAPALLLLSDWLLAHPAGTSHVSIAFLCYLVYLLPLIGPLARWTHVQPSVLAMAALLGMLARIPAETTAGQGTA